MRDFAVCPHSRQRCLFWTGLPVRGPSFVPNIHLPNPLLHFHCPNPWLANNNESCAFRRQVTGHRRSGASLTLCAFVASCSAARSFLSVRRFWSGCFWFSGKFPVYLFLFIPRSRSPLGESVKQMEKSLCTTV